MSAQGTQRLGVVPAFCGPGVVALHGTEAPRAGGGRMQEATGPEVPLRGEGGCSVCRILAGDPAPHRGAT